MCVLGNLAFVCCGKRVSQLEQCGAGVCEQLYPKALKCCSISPQMPGIFSQYYCTAWSMEVSQESLCITAVHTRGELPVTNYEWFPFLSCWVLWCIAWSHAAMGRKDIFLTCVLCLGTCFQNPIELTSQLVFFQLLRLLCTEPGSLRHSCMCSQAPQADVMLALVLGFLYHGQLVLDEATVPLSDPLQHCFLHHSWTSAQALYTPWNLNYRVFAEARWDIMGLEELGSGRTWPFSSFISAHREEEICSANCH